jgi:hypothetical protein
VSKSRQGDVSRLDVERLIATTEHVWNESAIPALCDYIRIPNKSPMFDARWRENGHMDRAVELIDAWCRRHAPPGTSFEVVRLEGRTPLLFMELAGTGG